MVIYAALKSTIVLNENTVGSAISRRPVPAEFYRIRYIPKCQNNMPDVIN